MPKRPDEPTRRRKVWSLSMRVPMPPRHLRLPVWALTSATVVVVLIGAAVGVALLSGAAMTSETTRSSLNEQLTGLGNGLRHRAHASGLKIGAAAQPTALAGNEGYRTVLSREFDSVTSENQLKWDIIEPSRGLFDWSSADALIGFAEANGQSVRGHTLVWHDALPGWLANGSFSPEELRNLLRDHIHAVVGRYKGRVDAWDVVNEAVADNGGRLRRSPWMDALGPGYIADALRWAHEADPAARLYINDYAVEAANMKSDALYNIAAGLRRDGVPLHGVGFQSHLALGADLTTLGANLRRFADLGLDVAITEMDVRLPLPATAAQHAEQADLYTRVLQACLAVERCVSYTVWGFTDRYSWVPYAYPGWGDACLFDGDYQPKPAYLQLRRMLVDSPRR
ncbi:endo-1,4-beta-xylanase [Virgisporangium ochraceum]